MLPEFNRLQLEERFKDALIEERIRPKRRKVESLPTRLKEPNSFEFAKLPRSLLPAADSRISELQQRPQPVASVAREQLQRADIQRLQPRQWLNDEIVNFYGAMIVERAERWTAGGDVEIARKREDIWFGADELGGSMPPKLKSRLNCVNGTTRKGKEPEHGEPLNIHYFNTFFYAKLTGPGYEKARLNKWTKKVR